MTSEERLKELVLSGIGSKPYNVQRVIGANMVADFVSCKLDVILVECDCEGKYTTGMQVSLLEKFPELKEQVDAIPESARTLGSIVPITVMRKHKNKRGVSTGFTLGYIVNVYTRKTSGWGMRRDRVMRKHDNFLMPVSHFYPEAITQALNSVFDFADSLVAAGLAKKHVNIACPRLCRGVGGSLWSDVETAILQAVDSHKKNIRVYLPRNPDNEIVQGDNSKLESGHV
jgi:hypothetical protein